MNIFPPHGKLDIKIENNLIIIEAQGPWNIEYLQYLHQQLLSSVAKVDVDNYGILISPIDDAISVKEGFEYHLNFIRHATVKAVAVNLARCTSPLMTENICRKLYGEAEINHSFFTDETAARTWLNSQLQSNCQQSNSG